MKISVIIPVYNRKEFVLQAVDSVLKNKISSDLQIIVVTNLSDTEINENLIKRGVEIISSRDETLGGKIAEATLKCDGDIISILEDDDRFNMNKIRIIEKEFEDRRLGFFHNSVSVIDLNGKEKVSPRTKHRILNVPNERKEEFLKDIHEMKGYYNTSSMTLRREIMMDIVPYMKKIKLNADLLLFLGALRSDLDLKFSTMRLTEYRKHNSFSNPMYHSFRDFLQNNFEFMDILLKDSLVYQEMMKDEPLYQYTLAWMQFIKKSAFLFSHHTFPIEELQIDKKYNWVPFGKRKNRMIDAAVNQSPFIRKFVLRLLYMSKYSISP